MVTSWNDVGPHTTPASTVYELDSERTGGRLQVTIARPPLAGPDAGPVATLYVLDPSQTIDVVIGITRSLSVLSFGAFPPLLVVGIGYPTADLMEVMSARMRDLTPTDALPPPALAPPAPSPHGFGGGDRFLDAITEEVMPVVESEHGGDPTDRTIVGWSIGGLFALHALFTRPGLFHRYLLASPSMWWDDRYVLRAEEAAADSGDIAGDIYMAVGDREESAASRSWPDAMSAEAIEVGAMVTNALTLTRRLRSRGHRHLDIETEVLADEHHATIFPTAASRGLFHLFGPR